jgi:uncharacterized protein (DUF697 family)
MNSDAEKHLKDRAKSIIRNYSIASGTASGALAIAAFLSVDLAFSTSIVVKMIAELARLFGRLIDEVKFTDQYKALIQKFIVVSVSKRLISFVPGFGNVVNGLMTYHLIESIGWAVYEILRDGKNPSDLDDEEVKAYLKRGEKNKVKY